MIELIEGYAQTKNVTPTQIALAWDLAQRPYIIPIPGTRTTAHMQENLAAADVDLRADEIKAITDALNAMNLADTSSRRNADPYRNALKK